MKDPEPPAPGQRAPSSVATDQWARWLLRDRFGGSADRQRIAMNFLVPIRDRVLTAADIGPGDVVLDMGCGDGLLGFGALDRCGPSGRVIFTDISPELLAECARLAEIAEVGDRSTFVRSTLPGLGEIPSSSVDVVVIRSVLIYVSDKRTAFRHLARVLGPGGRLSLFEPINQFSNHEPRGWLWGFDVSAVQALASRLLTTYRRYQDVASSMIDFDERDLLTGAEEAGFTDLRLQYEATIGPVLPTRGMALSTFLDFAPNPAVPPFGQLVSETFDAAEQQLFLGHLEAQLATGVGRSTMAAAYLTGRRGPPGDTLP